MNNIFKKIQNKYYNFKVKNAISIKSILLRIQEYRIHFTSTLSIVCIAKNEGLYIKEWLDFHFSQGVEKIYIYDNESTDNLLEIIQPYVETKKVVYIYFPGKGRQIDAYNDAIDRFKFKSKYLAFIDVDEFLMSENIDDNLISVIDKVMRFNKRAGGIGVNWRMYGSSGIINRKEGLVINTFLMRGRNECKGNECIKSIVNPRFVDKFSHVHYPSFVLGFNLINELGIILENWENITDRTVYLRINHYFTKSKEEWIKRRSLGKADSLDVNNKRTLEEFEMHDNNDILDDLAVKTFNKNLK